DDSLSQTYSTTPLHAVTPDRPPPDTFPVPSPRPPHMPQAAPPPNTSQQPASASHGTRCLLRKQRISSPAQKLSPSLNSRRSTLRAWISTPSPRATAPPISSTSSLAATLLATTRICGQKPSMPMVSSGSAKKTPPPRTTTLRRQKFLMKQRGKQVSASATSSCRPAPRVIFPRSTHSYAAATRTSPHC